MILYAVYLATLSKATAMTRSSNERLQVFLTRVGGHAFGNKDLYIREAIKYSLQYFEKSPINVYLVNYEPGSGFDETNKVEIDINTHEKYKDIVCKNNILNHEVGKEISQISKNENANNGGVGKGEIREDNGEKRGEKGEIKIMGEK